MHTYQRSKMYIRSTVIKQLQNWVLVLWLSFGLVLLPIPYVFANPTNGNVVAGTATIAEQGTNVTIQQTTDKAIIDWSSFNIASHESTTFQQPNSSAIALNRVLGNDPSQILGSLTANGQIMLINPAGIIFGAGSRVDVGGMLATTLDIANNDFLNGNYKFAQGLNSANGFILNQGTLQAKDGGMIALVGSAVRNEGVIIANLGKVILATGTKYTIDMFGDGLINIAASDQVLNQTYDLNGQPVTASITNTGTISAAGGAVVLAASAARSAVDTAINTMGLINASSATVGKGGVILLSGGEGDVKVSGQLKATGAKGGSIHISGKNITLKSAKLDVSGTHGGGDINIGDKPADNTPDKQAETLTIDKDTILDASAIMDGDGGNIILWSKQFTDYQGSIKATGGELNGNGGFAEVSGEALLSFKGKIDLTAPNGEQGTLLLDPYNIIIQASGITNGSISSGTYTAGTNDSILLVSDLQNALASSNVTVTTGTGGTQAGDITVNSNITWSNASNLILRAYRDINVNAAITNTGGGSLLLQADSSAIGSGNLNLAGNITTGGALNLGTRPSILNTDVTLTTTNTDITLGGTINGAHGLTVNAGTANINLNASIGGSTPLASATFNSPVMLGANVGVSTTNGAINFGNSITGSIRNLSLTSGTGAITLKAVNVKQLYMDYCTNGDCALNLSGNINTTGYFDLRNRPTTLLNNITITATDFINLNNTVNGAHNLTLNAGTTVNLLSAIGNTTPLSSVNITSGAYTYVDNKASITTNNGAITFNGSIDSSAANIANGVDAFTLSSGTGAITLHDTNVGSLILNGTGTLYLGGQLITNAGSANINRPVTLIANSEIITADTNLSFSNGISGNYNLTLNARSGTISLKDVNINTLNLVASGTYHIGQTPVNYVAGPLILGGNITTIGAFSSGNSSVTLSGNSSVTTTDNAISFNSDIDGNSYSLSLTSGTGAITLKAFSGQALTLSGTGNLNLGGNILTAKALNLGTRATVLNSGVILATTNNDITLGGTINGTQSFNVFAGTANINLNASIGNTTPLTAVTFNSPVVLGANVGVTTTNGAINFGNTVTGSNYNLSLTSGTGAITLKAVNVNALTLSGTGNLNLGGNITTASTLNLGTRATVLTSGVTLATTNNDITLGGTIDGAQSLTVNAGTANINLNASIGNTSPLAAVTFSSPVVLGANVGVTTTNGAINFGNTVTGSNYNLSLTSGTGAITLKAVNVNALTLSGTGNLNLGGNITTTGALNLGTRATVLNTNVTLATANTDITLGGTVNGAQSLTVNAGTANINLNASIGNTTPLTAVTFSSPVVLGANVGGTTTNGAINFGNSITGSSNNLSLTSGTGAITLKAVNVNALTLSGSGNLNLGGNITTTSALNLGTRASVLNTDVTLTTTNTDITLGGTVNGAQSLTVNAGTANINLNASIGNTTPLTAVTFSSPVVLGANVGVTTTNGDISFGNSVSGSSNNLSLSSGTGAITLKAVNVNALTLSGSGNLNLGGNITTTGALNLGTRASVLNTDVTLTTTNTDITLGGTINGAQSLTVNAGTANINLNASIGNTTPLTAVTFSSPVVLGASVGVTTTNGAINFGNSITGSNNNLNLTSGTGAITLKAVNVNALTLSGSGNLNLGGNITTTSALNLGTRASILNTDVTLTTTNTDITLGGTVNGAQSLTVNAGTANINLNASIGNTTPLTAVTFSSPVVLGANVGVTTTNGAINFGNSVTGSSYDLSLTSGTGAITLAAVSTNSLTLTGTGTVSLGGNITTTGAVSIGNQAVTLASNVNIATTNSAISFGNSVSGSSNNLSLSSGTGAITLKAINVNALTLSGSGNLNLGGNITTTGALNLGTRASVLNTDVTLTTTNTDITLGGTINGAQSLTVNAGTANINLNASIGNTTPLTAVTFSSPVVLGANVGVTTTNGAINFGNTITGSSYALSLTSGTGAVTLKTVNVNALTLSGSGNLNLDGNITTTGASNFGAYTVTLGSDTILTTTNSPISFGGNISGSSYDLSLTTGTGTITLQGVNVKTLSTNNGTGTINLGGNISTTNNLTFASPVNLTGDVTVATTNNNIMFDSTVNGAHNLNVSSGTGNVSFNGMVGNTTPLTSLTLSGSGAVTFRNDVITQQAITVNAPIALTNNVSLTSNTSDIVLNNPISGSYNLTLNGTNISLPTISINSLTLNSTGEITLNSDITTPQALTFNAPVILGHNLALTTSNNDITFNSPLNGSYNLTLTAGTGNVDFNDKVGDITPVNTIDIISANVVTIAKSFFVNTYLRTIEPAISKSENTDYNNPPIMLDTDMEGLDEFFFDLDSMFVDNLSETISNSDDNIDELSGKKLTTCRGS